MGSGSVPEDLVRDFLKEEGFPNPGFSKSSTQDLNSSRYVIYVDRGADCNIDRCKGLFYSHYFKHNSVYCLYDVLYFNFVLISCEQYDLRKLFVYVSLNSGCILPNFENTDCIKNRLLQSLIT